MVASEDRNVEAVREKLWSRSEVGLSKYGVTTERSDLTTLEWLRHAQEEALDLAVYLERLISDHDQLERERDEARKLLARYAGALIALSAPCTRGDYSVGELDQIVCKLAREALAGEASA